MENNVRKILMDRPLVIPRIIINNYKKLNITEEELIILIFIIDYGVDLEYNPSIFVQELNIDKYKVLELINSLKEKNILTILIKKENKKVSSEYISLQPLYDKIMNIVMDNKEKQIEIDENIYSIFENELGRTLSPLEYEKIKEMVTSYGQELVVEALKEAVYNRANNLRYIETILSEWNKKGYKSKVDILKDRENYRKKKTDNIKLPDIDWLNEDE
ncbi:MAG: DnaD domain protein [Bacilli bacterium]|jgi:DNA replication protein|nr:DnaD domain protein [Clostridium sp.]MDY3797802.1 DnaD domain protein [Bacilli bacterium]CDE95824.1 dNA replication protein DnaD [Clostridium sp. CAG:914]